MNNFPEYACAYAKKLASISEKFARQVYDVKNEIKKRNNYGIDPFGELTHASKCFGLKQRFPDRVLIMTANSCFMNCRHCTRRGLLTRAEVVQTSSQLNACLDYVKKRPEIRDVLLSGGDILTLSDDEVLKFVDAFAALPQIDIVRVCTRALCTNPARVTRSLAKKLSKSKKVWVNTQFNCADELTDDARKAAARLIDCGIPVSCQTVLLKNINDTTEDLLALFKALSSARIRPYYVFTCDPVSGIEQFRVSRARARQLERECAVAIGGLSMPRFVSDIPNAKRKTPV